MNLKMAKSKHMENQELFIKSDSFKLLTAKK